MLYKARREARRKKRQQQIKERIDRETNFKLEPRKVDLKDFPNSKKKLVVQNIPLDVSEQEINQFFFTILSQVAEESYSYNPITAVQRYPTMGFVTLEFKKRQDSEYCLKLDDVIQYSDKLEIKIKINRVPRFIEIWNDIIDSGKNPVAHLISGKETMFQDTRGGFGGQPLFGNNRYHDDE